MASAEQIRRAMEAEAPPDDVEYRAPPVVDVADDESEAPPSAPRARPRAAKTARAPEEEAAPLGDTYVAVYEDGGKVRATRPRQSYEQRYRTVTVPVPTRVRVPMEPASVGPARRERRTPARRTASPPRARSRRPPPRLPTLRGRRKAGGRRSGR